MNLRYFFQDLENTCLLEPALKSNAQCIRSFKAFINAHCLQKRVAKQTRLFLTWNTKYACKMYSLA